MMSRLRPRGLAVLFALCCQGGVLAAGAATHATHAPKAQLATGAAFDPQGHLWIVGLNSQGRLFVQHAPPQALTRWSPPQVLETGSDAISADGENRPKLAFGPNRWAVISYTQPLDKPYTGFIRMLRSEDGGGTFSMPFTVHQDRQEITHRFESIAFDAAGTLHTLWIDKRDLQAPQAGGRKYVGAAIYRNTSADGGATFTPDAKVADHTCECCRIGIALDGAGKPHALWRHVFGEQTRDHAFAGLATGGMPTVVRATEDDWQVNACPHHGPGLAAAQDGFHAVWFGIRQVEGQPRAAVRYGRLAADGRPRPDTVRVLPDPRAEHADVAAYKDNVAIVWRSSQGRRTTLKAWISRDAGRSFVTRTLGSTQGENDHPRLVQSGPKMVVVWRLPQEVQVHEVHF